MRLRQSEEKYRQILEQAADAIIRVNASGHVIDAKRRAQELFASTGVLDHRIDSLVEEWRSQSEDIDSGGTALWESRLKLDNDAPVSIEISAKAPAIR